MPCREWFDEQDQGYKDSVIPPEIRARVSIEAGVGIGWRDLVGDAGRIISINHYGASAAGESVVQGVRFHSRNGRRSRTTRASMRQPGLPHPRIRQPAGLEVPQTKRPTRASRSAESS